MDWIVANDWSDLASQPDASTIHCPPTLMDGATADRSLVVFIVALGGVAGTQFTPLSSFHHGGRES
jgi:hypothetical protein